MEKSIETGSCWLFGASRSGKKVEAGYKKNPVGQSKSEKIDEASKRFTEFTGHIADSYDSVKIDWPDVGFVVGKVCGFMYETVREGEVQYYCHEFKKSARPDFAVSHDGKQIIPIGGKYTFTDRGIVDN